MGQRSDPFIGRAHSVLTPANHVGDGNHGTLSICQCLLQRFCAGLWLDANGKKTEGG
jgi:hypothetical protein